MAADHDPGPSAACQRWLLAVVIGFNHAGLDYCVTDRDPETGVLG